MRLGHFVGSMCDFLAVIMEANCETNEVPVFNIETAWSNVRGKVTLPALNHLQVINLTPLFLLY